MTELIDGHATDIAPATNTEAKAPAGPSARAARKPKTRTKGDAVIALLNRSRGATLDDMMKATGWQAHSVRGFLAGTLKKKLGRGVVSEVTDKGRVYRIAAEAR